MNLAQVAQLLGRRGGKARAARLAPSERRRVASLGGAARAESYRKARLVAVNFRYVAAVRDLQRSAVAVERLTHFDGPLPGIYRDGR